MSTIGKIVQDPRELLNIVNPKTLEVEQQLPYSVIKGLADSIMALGPVPRYLYAGKKVLMYLRDHKVKDLTGALPFAIDVVYQPDYPEEYWRLVDIDNNPIKHGTLDS